MGLVTHAMRPAPGNGSADRSAAAAQAAALTKVDLPGGGQARPVHFPLLVTAAPILRRAFRERYESQ